eukprot:scaffold520902_cov20-Prasinocladus_malaysianus.AAC.1
MAVCNGLSGASRRMSPPPSFAAYHSPWLQVRLIGDDPQHSCCEAGEPKNIAAACSQNPWPRNYVV